MIDTTVNTTSNNASPQPTSADSVIDKRSHKLLKINLTISIKIHAHKDAIQLPILKPLPQPNQPLLNILTDNPPTILHIKVGKYLPELRLCLLLDSLTANQTDEFVDVEGAFWALFEEGA
jgi:hypothetical protein